MQLMNPSNATSALRAPFTSPAASADSTAASNSNTNSGTATATLTADDFLQLLVTELQNQDPTANTDPNEYVDQLVQVNTLQQQIQMNQTLDGGPTLTGASNGVLQELVQMNQTLDGDVSGSTGSQVSQMGRADGAASSPARVAAETSRPVSTTGNLSATENPATEASAEAIATALSGNPNRSLGAAGSTGLKIPASQMGAFAQFAARLKAGNQRIGHQGANQ